MGYSGADSNIEWDDTGYGLDAYGFSESGRAEQRGSAAFGLRPVFWKALSAANAEMKSAGLGTFGITSGYRSLPEQVKLKQKEGDRAADAGDSVHGVGLAADLRLSKKQAEWLEVNKQRLGLVTFPSEAWHVQLDPRLWK